MEIKIRPMTIEDYDEVYALWMTIKGFGIRFQRGDGAFPKTESYHKYRGGGRWKACWRNLVWT